MSKASIALFLFSTVSVLGLSMSTSKRKPPVKAIFFDCDDCLYQDNWYVAGKLTEAIESFCTSELGLPSGKAYDLYKEHGTALLGLLNEGLLERSAVDNYLKVVHDIQVKEHLRPDPKLRELLLRIDPSIKTYIFTASVKHHAVECLKALGIYDLFEDRIIDTKVCKVSGRVGGGARG
jgi:pyrimidine 5'-nucleotidase